MKPFSFFYLVIFVFVAVSCQNQPKDTSNDDPYSKEEMKAQDELWDKVMELHDEVMPETAKINSLSQELEPYLEDVTLEKPTLEKINNSLKALEAGEESMFSWMSELQQLGVLRNGKKHDEIMTYLQGELNKMGTVKEKMMTSITNGEALLSELQGVEE
ncbi:MAG: hypothetical protein DHS20C18_55320 [Saprospiraceae bacterium]|nr:MAG: hypothetical protein DHS20C18_55320 [Saprospiraceae bacterium]